MPLSLREVISIRLLRKLLDDLIFSMTSCSRWPFFSKKGRRVARRASVSRRKSSGLRSFSWKRTD